MSTLCIYRRFFGKEGTCKKLLTLRRKDAIIIAGALLLAACWFGASLLSSREASLSGAVQIHVGNTLYQTVPLGQEQHVRIEQENGHVNIIAIDAHGAHMAESSCKNQLCLQQGAVTDENYASRVMGRYIICLPNQVVIELALADTAPPPDREIADV